MPRGVWSKELKPQWADAFRQKKDALDRPERTDPIDWIIDAKAGEPSPLAQLENAQIRAIVKKEVEKLPSKYRLVIELNIFRELPIGEVAKILNVSENNAYSIKHRAIQRLKANILRKKN